MQSRNIVTLKNTLHKNLYLNRYDASCFFSSNVSRIRGNEFEPYQTESDSNKYVRAVFSKAGSLENQKKSNCLLTLSIGQPVHEGVHLAATLSLINTNFRSCTFVLGDTLQRHTMKITESSFTEKELLIKSEKNGDAWIKNNVHLLSLLRIPWTVKRWDHWLEHNRFQSLLGKVKESYISEPKYKVAFDENIETYLSRLKERGELNLDEAEAYNKCLDYLQEECAAMCLWVDERCEYELYAHGRTKAMQATYERFIEMMYPDLLKPISLRFKKSLITLSDCSTDRERDISTVEVGHNIGDIPDLLTVRHGA